jgi:protein-S-isoprenylcysteine O-methyltransferase Ste14
MVKRVIYPPVWLLLGLIAIFMLNEFYPIAHFTSLAAEVVGGAIIVIDLLLLVLANGLFVRAGTDVIPFRNVTKLVTSGVYRYTRNPMYLGMFAVLLGCAVTVGAVSALAVPLLVAAIVEARFIRPEEQMLRGLFPEEYPAYCARVRRWL